MPKNNSDKSNPDLGVRVLTSVDELVFPEIQHVYGHWDKLRAGRAAPQQWEYDLLDLPDFIHLMMHGRVDERLSDIVVLFVGQSFVNVLKYDPTGKLISELAKEVIADRTLEITKLVIEEKKPVVNGRSKPSQNLKFIKSFQSLTLPLVSDNKVKEVIGITQFQRA